MGIHKDTVILLAVVGVVVIPLLVAILFRVELRFDDLTTRFDGDQAALDVIQGQVGPAERRVERAQRRGIDREAFIQQQREEEEEEEEEEEALGSQFGIRDEGQKGQGGEAFLDGRYLISRVTATLDSKIPGARGDIELTLDIDMDPPVLAANALVDGLSPDSRYTLCLSNQVIDTNEADAQGSLILEEAVIFTESTLSGLIVSIREGRGCGGEVSLQAVISE